jgi:transposase-like protein
MKRLKMEPSVGVVRVLEELKSKVEAHRKGLNGKQVRYTKEIREGVMECLSGGIPIQEIHRALGIHPTTLGTWSGKYPRKRRANELVPSGEKSASVRELKLVSDRIGISSGSVRIHLSNRVMMEIPAGMLRGDLLREIAALGVV